MAARSGPWRSCARSSRSRPTRRATGWGGPAWRRLSATRAPGSELNPPALTHDRLVLFARPPEELDLLYEGVKRHVPPAVGSISVVPAGSPAMWRWSGRFDWLCVVLEPGLVARVAAVAFDLDPARLTVPPLDGLDLPPMRAAMRAVDAELTAGGSGGRLAAESLANVLAVHLIRRMVAPRRLARGRDGALPRGRPPSRRRVHRGTPRLEPHPGPHGRGRTPQPATTSGRQFTAATGLPLHQFAIGAQRVERAKHLLKEATT